MPSAGLLDQDQLVKYLVEKTQNATTPLTMIHIMSEYKAIAGHVVTARTLRNQFRHDVAPRVHEMEDYDDETKVKLIFATSSAINPEFLAKLRLHATVEVDEKQRITKYASATLQREGKHHSPPFKPFDPLLKRAISLSMSDFKFRSIKTEVQDAMDDPVDHVERKSMKMDLDLSHSSTSSGGSVPNPLDSFLELMAQNSSSQNSMDLDPPGPAALPNPSGIQSPPAFQVSLPETPKLPSNSLQEDPSGGEGEGQFVSAIGNFLNSMNGMFGVITENMMNRNDTTTAAAPQSSPSSIEATAASNAPSPCQIETPITTKKQFLTHIQMCLLSIDNLQLSEFYHRVTGELEKCRKNEPLVMSKLRLALQTIVTVSMAHGFGSRRENEGAEPPPQTTNAKKFLQLLEMFISAQETPELIQPHEELKTIIASTDDAKQIEVKMVQMAFETALITMGI